MENKIIMVGNTIVRITEDIDYLSLVPKDAEVFYIVDINVFRANSEIYKYMRSPGVNAMTLTPTEKLKVPQNVTAIHDWLLYKRADRNSMLIAIGGGITSDIVGYAAATYMRGIRFGIVSTTLLGQVDAAIGGKNGVNMGNFKNVVGSFLEPEFVNCPLSVLKTLPIEQFNNGIAEIVKYKVLSPESIGSTEDVLNVQRNSTKTYENIVPYAIWEKKKYVEYDLKEQNMRKMLNFGHTIGHALELSDNNFGMHGRAVATGMIYAMEISSMCNREYELQKIRFNEMYRILNYFDLIRIPSISTDKIIDGISVDKKKNKDKYEMVLIDHKDKPYLRQFTLDEMTRLIDTITPRINQIKK